MLKKKEEKDLVFRMSLENLTLFNSEERERGRIELIP